MAKEYELALVLRPDLDEEHQNAVLARYRQVVETHGGALEDPNVWGKRRLAYEINDTSEGIYIFLPFTGQSTVNAELDRLLRIDENVLRYLVVVRPRPNPPKPSTMPEAAGGHGEGRRSAPIPAGERQGPGLPVRRSEVAAQRAQGEPASQPTPAVTADSDASESAAPAPTPAEAPVPPVAPTEEATQD